MLIYLKYMKYVFKHRWYVFQVCCKLGIPWLGIIHDISKFSFDEWIPYAKHFNGKISTGRDKTGYYKPTDTGDAAFDFAWLLHQKRNKHHWQWWILPCDTDGTKILEIPLKYRKEMLADWIGAGKAQGANGDWISWYKANGNKLQLGPETRAWYDARVSYLSLYKNCNMWFAMRYLKRIAYDHDLRIEYYLWSA